MGPSICPLKAIIGQRVFTSPKVFLFKGPSQVVKWDVVRCTAFAKGSFKNHVGIILLISDHPSTSVDTFYVLNVDKNGKFLTTYPPPFVHVVIECPLRVVAGFPAPGLNTRPSVQKANVLAGTTTNASLITEGIIRIWVLLEGKPYWKFYSI